MEAAAETRVAGAGLGRGLWCRWEVPDTGDILKAESLGTADNWGRGVRGTGVKGKVSPERLRGGSFQSLRRET